jgi:adenylate cyclase
VLLRRSPPEFPAVPTPCSGPRVDSVRRVPTPDGAGEVTARLARCRPNALPGNDFRAELAPLCKNRKLPSANGYPMTTDRSTRKLAVVLHADVTGSTALVQRDETLAHERVRDAFRRFSETIRAYGGTPQELRGDALLATFSRASDAVSASLSFQAGNAHHNETLEDDIRPEVRIGIAIGEVVIADGTLTGSDVVMAQRIEQLAEAGGICIQGTAYETIPRRLLFEYTSLGERQLKGFDEPVRVYAVKPKPGEEIPGPEPQPQATRSSGRRTVIAAIAVSFVIVGGVTAWLRPWESEVERADPAKMAYALPDKPSVAVLPFENLSADREQVYFSDGVTEDIITDLSKISGLFVIARDSSFTYKGQPVKIRQVAEELGVRYVLEGSVRRAEEKIRITAQLIDALKGNHIWAERYDGDLEDVFSLQSEVARQVAKALAVTLKANEYERLFQKYTTSIDAYDVFLQARRTVDEPTKDNFERGQKLFSRVIELDRKFAGGYAGLAFNYSVQVRHQHSKSPSSDLARAFDLANKAVEVDSTFAWGYIALGGAYVAKGDAVAAVNAVRQALTLEPNSYEANLFMGFYLQFAGESALAVDHLLMAKRLSPGGSVRDLAFLALAQFMNRNYTETVRIYTTMDRKFPRSRTPNNRVVLAAAYTLLERPEEAAAVVIYLLESHPDFNLSQWRFFNSWKSEENRDRLYNAAKKAGIPEFPKDN